VVRAYAWRMTVERAPPDINFRYPETRLSSREYAPTNFRCAASASAVSSSSPAVSSRAVRTPADPPPTAGRAEAGRRPLSCRLGSGIALSGRLNDGGSPRGVGRDGVASNEIGGLFPELRMALFLARQRDLSSTTFVQADAPRLADQGRHPLPWPSPPTLPRLRFCRLHSMSRLGSAATAASVLTVLRECGVVRRRRSGPPADHYDQSQPVLLTEGCSGRRRAPWSCGPTRPSCPTAVRRE
jgi:hypothetical protein